MQLIDPDILALTRQLSPGVSVVTLLIGLALWLFGASSYRFWLCLMVTVGAGLVGLLIGREHGVQPLVAGLLLALAAGSLGLAVARIGLFIAGGLAAVLVVRLVVPSSSELVSFVVGGLIGIFFDKLWIMALTSLFGTLLMVYGGASLLAQLGRLDPETWATQNTPLINWGLISGTLTGILMQFLRERRLNQPPPPKKEAPKPPELPPVVVAPPPPPPAAPSPPPPPPPPPSPPQPWWRKVPDWFVRKAS
jgi:hypothetical protein